MSSYQQIEFQLKDNIATITLANGKVNAFSHQLIGDVNAALDEAEREGAVVIITGSPGILSAGYDLKVMQSGPEAATALVTEGSTLAHRLLSFPTPVIVACSGHAVAKGAFLLLSADIRLGVEGDFKIGLNEVDIGMTMHYAGLEIAKARLPDAYFNRSVLCAEMFSPEDAVKAGFLDKIVPADQLMAQAVGLAAHFNKNMKMKAHTGTKLKARKEYLDRLQRAIEADANGLSFG